MTGMGYCQSGSKWKNIKTYWKVRVFVNEPELGAALELGVAFVSLTIA